MKIVAQNFAKKSDFYNRNSDIQQVAASTIAKKVLPYIKKDDIGVDLGSGTGYVNQSLKHDKLIELDFAFDMLEKSSANLKICADFSNLPFLNESLDFVVSSFALQWSYDFEEVFLQVYNSLKKGGVFAFAIPCFESLEELKIVNEKSGCNFEIVNLVKFQEILEFLQKTGFTKIEHERIFVKKEYLNAIDVFKKIKQIGASSPKINKNFISRKKIKKINDFFFEKYDNVTKWDINYFICQKKNLNYVWSD